jgi:hypothetical protein
VASWYQEIEVKKIFIFFFFGRPASSGFRVGENKAATKQMQLGMDEYLTTPWP